MCDFEIELIIAHPGAKSLSGGLIATLAPPPSKTLCIYREEIKSVCEVSQVGCTVGTSIVQDPSRVTFKVTFGKELHDSVNLLCFPRKMEAKEEHTAREMQSGE